MAESLHMAQLAFDIRELLLVAHRHGQSLDRDFDGGYVIHTQLARLFGERAPQPFRIEERRGTVGVLGYTTADQETLREMVAFAEPEASAPVKDIVRAKPMPARWGSGRRYTFQLRMCPVARGDVTPAMRAAAGERPSTGNRPLGKTWERDVYQHRAETWSKESGDEHGYPRTRAEVYEEWLAERLAEGGARLVDGTFGLDAFRRARFYRRRQEGARRGKALERPDVTCHGTLQVTDGRAFGDTLARGVGRHRAFGFGMLLLRPA